MEREKIKEYLRIDSDDEDEYIDELIGVSEAYIDSMIGESYKSDEKAVQLSILLRKKLIADMYENRTTIVNGKRDIIVDSILDRLSLIRSDENG